VPERDGVTWAVAAGSERPSGSGCVGRDAVERVAVDDADDAGGEATVVGAVNAGGRAIAVLDPTLATTRACCAALLQSVAA
jgi:hypothetical protein